MLYVGITLCAFFASYKPAAISKKMGANLRENLVACEHGSVLGFYGEGGLGSCLEDRNLLKLRNLDS